MNPRGDLPLERGLESKGDLLRRGRCLSCGVDPIWMSVALSLKLAITMLTLERRRERSIYSLSANGGEVKGYMGPSPQLDTTRYRTSAGDQSSSVSGAAGRPVAADRPLILARMLV